MCHISEDKSFPTWLNVKNLPVNVGDVSSILAGEDPLEEEMATHSSILAWETPWTEGAWRATDHRLQKELDMTLQLNTNNTRALHFSNTKYSK